jgi:DNA modification methylase
MVENIEDFGDIESIAKKYSTNNEIKINPEYEKIVPPLTSGEYNLLKSSIKESGGNVVPIIVNKQNEILDGYHRYRACLDLGLDSKIEIIEFSDPVSEKEFVIVINLKRRQLNSFQISELGYKLEEIEREKARKRQLKYLKNVGDSYSSSSAPNGTNEEEKEKQEEIQKGRVSEIIAKKIGISPRTYERNRKIIEEGSKEQKEELRQGKISINKVYNKIDREKKKKELLSQLSNSVNQSGWSSSSLNLIEGDFIEKGKDIHSESVDLIFTYPVYSSKDVNIYYELTSLANRVLKPGCSFVTHIGLHNLSEILEIAKTNNLHFWWILAVKLNGNTRSFPQRKINIKWKPLLWFVKGEKLSESSSLVILNEYVDDFVESKPAEKILHTWEQSIVEAEHVIKKLTLENQVVLDPMMGLGTTGIAASNLNRRFVGIEKDKQNFMIAKTRFDNMSVNNSISSPTS